MMLQEFPMNLSERITFSLRRLYEQQGYRRYKMSKFEPYDLYASNKDCLICDQVITFTDGSGKLMAMKPDVTLSIVKNSRTDNGIQKLYYNENVYRTAGSTGAFKEIMQVGLECLGQIDDSCICEVLQLAAKSLDSIRPGSVLAVSHLGILSQLADSLGVPEGKKAAVFRCISEKNSHELSALCTEIGLSEKSAALLKQVCSTSGEAKAVLPQMKVLLEDITNLAALTQLEQIIAALDTQISLRIDFSIVDDIRYYNGIVFKGFIPGLPGSILSGGQYDTLMKKMDRKGGAIGFAIYMDALERLEDASEDLADAATPMLNVALPKGRLGEKVYAMFAKAGYDCPAILENNRKLIFENPEKGVRYFWVKPSDVAIYVERGAADIGVAGKDILLEYAPDIYELLDLNIGKCRMAVAAKADFRDNPHRTLRVATKFQNIASRYYQEKGRDIDIIHLNGSIEIAPILGLSDVIVDIVETGTTLKENDLSVIETIVPISARLIANKAGYQFLNKKIDKLVSDLATQVEAAK